MKKFFQNKSFSKISLATLAIALVLGGFLVFKTQAGVGPVIPATGGESISIDTTTDGGSNTWTTISGLSIHETAIGDIALGIHTLTLPTGWEFDPTQTLSLSTDGFGLTLSSVSIQPASQAINFTVTRLSDAPDSIYFNTAIKIRPTSHNPSTGHITHSGAAIVGVTDGVTSFGAVNAIAGAITKLAVTTEPTDITYGDNVSTVEIRTKDQFGNNSTNGLASSQNITISKKSGAGTLSGTTTLDIGTSTGNGVVSFDDLSLDDIGDYVLTTGNGAGYTNVDTSSFNIAQKELTATLTVEDKIYDGTTEATSTARNPVGVEAGDTVTLTEGIASFEDKNVGTNKDVTATGLTLGGADASKYTYDGTATGTADITALSSKLGGTFTVNNKVYNRDTDATINTNSLTLVSLIEGDSVTISPTLAFANKIVADGKVVTITGATLGGTDGDNYSVDLTDAPSSTANITTKSLTITGSFTTQSKVYDSNTTASLESNNIGISGVVSGDDTGWTWGSISFDTKDVGTGKTVTQSITLTGTDKDNYSLASASVTYTGGVITKKPLTIGGSFVANDIDYNGTTITGLATNSLTLSGVIGEEIVSIIPALSFADKNYGTNKVVSITSDSVLQGADAGNYSINLTGAPTDTANINKRAVTLTRTIDTKVYDGTTSSDEAPTITAGTLASGDVGVFSQAFISKDVTTAGNAQINVSVVSIKDALDADMTGNYTVTLNHGTGGTITKKPLTVSDALVTSKVYDGGVVAEITGGELEGVEDGDTVTLEGATSGAFDTKNVGSDISVTTFMSLGGANAGNYSLTEPILTGEITPKALTVTAVTDTKVYDGTGATSSDGIPTDDGALIAGDTAVYSQAYANANAGINKTIIPSVVSIKDGLEADMTGNYDVTLVNNETGVIQAGPIDHFAVLTSTSIPTVDDPFDLTITAVDEWGNAISTENGVEPYTGVAFISTNATAPYTVPQSYAFLGSDDGSKTFTNGIRFEVPQEEVAIVVRDGTEYTIMGVSSFIRVYSEPEPEAGLTANLVGMVHAGATNGGWENPYEWVMAVTLPSDERSVSLQFANWTNGLNTGGNMAYWSEEVDSASEGGEDNPIVITSPNSYDDGAIDVIRDADSSSAGVQTKIHILLKIPGTTPAGSHSTTYKVQSVASIPE